VYDYRLDDWGSLPVGTKNFSSSLCVQTGSEAHPASYPMGTKGVLPRGKRGRGVTLTTQPHLVLRSGMRSYTFSPPWHLPSVAGQLRFQYADYKTEFLELATGNPWLDGTGQRFGGRPWTYVCLELPLDFP
jgi:hypothetical protein